MSVIDSDPVVVIDQGEDGVVAITVPPLVSLVGVAAWELVTGPTRGGASTKTYGGTISTVDGVTTASWTVPRADTLVSTRQWCVARVRYSGVSNTYRIFYRAEFLIRAGLT